MSWEEYCYYSHGYFLRQARQSEPLRIIAYTIYCSNTKKEERVSIEKFMPLLTDNLNKSAVDPEQRKKELAERRLKAKEVEKKLNEKLAQQHVVRG